MIAIDHEDRHEVFEPASSSAVAGILHGLVFVLPFWAFVASAVVIVATR